MNHKHIHGTLNAFNDYKFNKANKSKEAKEDCQHESYLKRNASSHLHKQQ